MDDDGLFPIEDRAPDRPGFRERISRAELQEVMVAVCDRAAYPLIKDFIFAVQVHIGGGNYKGLQRTILDHTTHLLYPPLAMLGVRWWWTVPVDLKKNVSYYRLYERLTLEEMELAVRALEERAHDMRERALDARQQLEWRKRDPYDPDPDFFGL